MSQVTAARQVGRFVTGLGALAILIGVLVGGPAALLALAGNPLPDHVPTLNEITTVLTSRDDGQLFLRALALLGWAGWATFGLSVLVEVPARILRRPAIRLPGLGRQQRAAAALVGSVAMILAVSPAATATAATLAGPPVATLAQAAPVATLAQAATPTTTVAAARTPTDPAPVAVPVAAAGPAPRWLAAPPDSVVDEPAPVYRVEKDDYLGHIADRYLGDFDRYPELARLNEIRNPDRIRPGQLLHLPQDAADRGHRSHATGLVAVPPGPGATIEEPAGRAGMGPAPEQAGPRHPGAQQPGPEQTGREAVPERDQPPVAPVPSPRRPSPDEATDGTTFASATGAGETQALNRPLAVAAVIAAASIVGAQIGAVLGLRRQTTLSRSRANSSSSGRHRRLPD